MSSFSNSWIRLAWIAAPRAESSEGLMLPGVIDGARILVRSEKTLRVRWAILGVCDVPPERTTCCSC